MNEATRLNSHHVAMFMRLTGMFAPHGVCEPIEGFGKQWRMIESAVRDMGKEIDRLQAAQIKLADDVPVDFTLKTGTWAWWKSDKGWTKSMIVGWVCEVWEDPPAFLMSNCTWRGGGDFRVSVHECYSTREAGIAAEEAEAAYEKEVEAKGD